MFNILRKGLAIVFLVLFFIPVVLMALAVEGINFAMIELTGRAMWNVGHVSEMYRALQAAKRLDKFGDLLNLLKKASGDGGTSSGGSVPNTPRNFN